MSHDTNGRPYAKSDNIVKGSIIIPDGGFSCMKAGTTKVVGISKDGSLCVQCSAGDHLLSGQLDPTNTFYVGFYCSEEALVE